jgi:hypothetical protein
MIETGRMELHELHVGDPTARAPGHGDAVAGGDVGVAGVEIDLVGPAGGQHHEAGEEGLDLPVAEIEDIGAQTAMLAMSRQMSGRDEIDGDVLLIERHIGALTHLAFERGGDRTPGGIGGMDHAPMCVTALTCEMIAAGCTLIGVARELDPLIEQPANVVRAALDDVAHHGAIAQPGAGLERVLDVRFDRVARVEDRRDAALGIERTALAQFALGDDRDGQRLGKPQGETQPGGAAAEDQDVIAVAGVGHGGWLVRRWIGVKLR